MRVLHIAIEQLPEWHAERVCNRHIHHGEVVALAEARAIILAKRQRQREILAGIEAQEVAA